MTETPSKTPDGGGDAPQSGWHPLRRTLSVIGRTASKAWDDSIFGKAATAAFWQTLSLPPLLLGLLGMLGYVGGWFGPDTVDIIQSKIINFSGTVFSDNVVEQIIRPTVGDVLQRGRPEIVSLSFLLSLWAGSSAISTFVDSIVEAHGQQEARHPVWQRLFALLLYVMFLILAVFTLPLVALGPTLVGRVLPEAWRTIGTEIVDTFYYPAVGLLLIVGLTTLYKVALPRSLPWHRLLGGALVAGVFFLGASTCLRWYLSWVAGTGYTYGALATPIAFLLFTFFLGFAVVLGAEFNATVQEFWPARATRIDQMKDWIAAQAEGSPSANPVTSLTRRIATGPIKIVGDRPPSDRPAPASGDSEPDSSVPERPEPPGVRRAAKPQSPLRNPS
ncbi:MULTISPECIES: YihY/virulence factor BrkB family protein [unclassified Rhodococcus (in: high G+C Gram-positive bacteria)]|uniref:YihY/virulence factor BrkB family protein n=1 Tax=unclassified Rhodococcus (in: high G+C Gram-positive bacteria) TaxID=192944 RepID=UPI00163AA1EC|nr:MULTISPECIES: YihY/virulence factor BrkB family protein [unclassified Rhodococcus (in: high G+C Gram-positive bacteria)]MBC2643922.1 YihY/virulence factor BrkB family protein [Rhodococcus sp. 3A]MBC2891338.1 YihY/virulence factor BrkB family protein [Rhodococcus sp. 4CII]